MATLVTTLSKVFQVYDRFGKGLRSATFRIDIGSARPSDAGEGTTWTLGPSFSWRCAVFYRDAKAGLILQIIVRRNWSGFLSLFVQWSEWTFRRVFTMIDPAVLEALIRAHAAETVLHNKQSDQIAIDGKPLRGSKRQGRVHVCILWMRGVMKMALFWARSKLKTSPIYPWAGAALCNIENLKTSFSAPILWRTLQKKTCGLGSCPLTQSRKTTWPHCYHFK